MNISYYNPAAYVYTHMAVQCNIVFTHSGCDVYIIYRYALCAGGEKRSGMSKRSAHIL